MESPSPSRCDTLVRGIVITMNEARDVYWDGYVAIADGKIVGVGSASDCAFTSEDVVSGDRMVVIPGLINTHAHLVQGCIRGMAEGTVFEERLFGFYYPMTAACDQQRSYDAALPAVMDLARCGVTTTADDHFTHQHKDSMDGVLRAITDVGIRSRSARLAINEPDAAPEALREPVDVALAETERLRKAWNSDLVTVTAGTISITYVGYDDLHQLWQWTQDNDEQFDIHAPSMMDRKYLAQNRGWTGGSFEWLDSEGMLNEKLIGIHAQMLQPGEHKLIADRGAAVGMVPDMELLLGLVQFNVSEYLRHGAKIGIGLDGPVVAYGHSLWNAMKSVIIGQRLNDGHRKLVEGDRDWDNTLVFGSAELALELATIRGAQALRMDDRIGSLEVGKDADVVIIDTSDQTTLSTRAALIPNLVYSAGPDPRSIARVMVRGRTICERGQIDGLDPQAVVRRADELQDTLLAETGCGKFVRKASPWTWHLAGA